MGSTSRAALASARRVLDGSGVDQAAAADLLAVARVLADTPALRAAFADAGAGSGKTVALAARIFGDQVQPAALPVVESAVTSRWSDQDELVDGLEELGIRAVASASDAERVVAELLSFTRIVGSQPELELALGDRLGDPAKKASLVDSLLAGKADPGTAAIASHLVRSPRGRRIGAMLKRAAGIVADQHGRVIAGVVAAAPLDEAQQQRLRERLGAMYDANVELDVVVDPDLIGGIRVSIGDDVIDGSVKARLAGLRQRLAG